MSRYNPTKKRCGLIKVPKFDTRRGAFGIEKYRNGDGYVTTKEYIAGKREVLVDIDALIKSRQRYFLNELSKQIFK